MFDVSVERPKKERLIRAFFSQFNKPVKNYLCFPSLSGLDIRVGLELGVLNNKTKIIAIERNKEYIDDISKSLKKLNLDFELCCGQVENIYVGNKLECGYIDLCGQLDADFLFWFGNLTFTDNAKIAFTFAGSTRSIAHSPSFYSRAYKGIVRPKSEYVVMTGNNHDDTDKLNLVAAFLTDVQPKIRFNISKYYHDTRAPMLFLGGYFGRTSYIKWGSKPKEKKPKLSLLEERIINFYKYGWDRHQQIGGLKISMNKLTDKEYETLCGLCGREMEYLGL